MAFTVSSTAGDTVMGNARVRYLRITADAAEDNVSSGLESVYGCAACNQSMTTGAYKVAINEDSSGTASQGGLGISGVASGDELLLTVWGK